MWLSLQHDLTPTRQILMLVAEAPSNTTTTLDPVSSNVDTAFWVYSTLYFIPLNLDLLSSFVDIFCAI